MAVLGVDDSPGGGPGSGGGGGGEGSPGGIITGTLVYYRFTQDISMLDEMNNRHIKSGVWALSRNVPILANQANNYTCALFNGINQYCCTNAESTNGTIWPNNKVQDFTWEFYIKPKRLSGRQTILSMQYSYMDATHITGFEIYLLNGRLYSSVAVDDSPGFDNTPENLVFTDELLSTEKFSHVVVRYDSSTRHKHEIFINGVSVKHTTAPYWFQLHHEDVTVGTLTGLYIARSSSASYNYFAGELDEIRLYNLALSDEQISDNYQASGLKENNMSAENASVYQDSILRLESTPGANDGTWLRLMSTNFDTDPEFMIRHYRKTGNKFATQRSIGKEHSSGKIAGDQNFNDLLLLVQGLITKPTSSSPSNNGRWSVVIDATGGTFTLTYGGFTTTNIAYNANAATIKTALVALDSVGGSDLVDVVTTSALHHVVTFRGPLAIGGALTGAEDLTGGASTVTVSTTAAGDGIRYRMKSLFNTADDPQTYVLQRGADGIANGAVEVPMNYISGLSFKWTPQEASLTGDFFGGETIDPVTMETEPTIVPIMEVDPACMSVWVGKKIAGTTDRQVKLKRLLDLELGITGKWNPLKTLDCDQPGISAGVEAAPTADVKFSIEHNDASQAIFDDVRKGDIIYMTFEALGPVDSISTGYRHRFWWTAALGVNKVNKGDMDGVYAMTYDCQINYDQTLGHAIEFVIDTDFDIT